MYVYMCVCVYMCVQLCVYIYVCVCISVYIYVCVYMGVYICVSEESKRLSLFLNPRVSASKSGVLFIIQRRQMQWVLPT